MPFDHRSQAATPGFRGRYGTMRHRVDWLRVLLVVMACAAPVGVFAVKAGTALAVSGADGSSVGKTGTGTMCVAAIEGWDTSSGFTLTTSASEVRVKCYSSTDEVSPDVPEGAGGIQIHYGPTTGVYALPGSGNTRVSDFTLVENANGYYEASFNLYRSTGTLAFSDGTFFMGFQIIDSGFNALMSLGGFAFPAAWSGCASQGFVPWSTIDTTFPSCHSSTFGPYGGSFIGTCDANVQFAGYRVNGVALEFTEIVDYVLIPGDQFEMDVQIYLGYDWPDFDFKFRVNPDGEFVTAVPLSLGGDHFRIDMSDQIEVPARVGLVALSCSYDGEPTMYYSSDQTATACGELWCTAVSTRACSHLVVLWPSVNRLYLAGDTLSMGFRLSDEAPEHGVYNLMISGFHDDTGLEFLTVLDREGDPLTDLSYIPGTTNYSLLLPGWEGTLEHVVVSDELWSEDVALYCTDADGMVLIAGNAGLPDHDGGVVGGGGPGVDTPQACLSGSGIGLSPSSWLPAAGRMGTCLVRVLFLPSGEGIEGFREALEEDTSLGHWYEPLSVVPEAFQLLSQSGEGCSIGMSIPTGQPEPVSFDFDTCSGDASTVRQVVYTASTVGIVMLGLFGVTRFAERVIMLGARVEARDR
jgi:hypothetical protein